MRGDLCSWDRDGEARARAERLIFAGSGGKCYLGGGSLQRPIHLSSWHPSWRGVGVRVGGVKWRGMGGEVGVWWGACAAGESAKVQDSLNGFSSAIWSQFGELEQTPRLLSPQLCLLWRGLAWMGETMAVDASLSLLVSPSHRTGRHWMTKPKPPVCVRSNLTHWLSFIPELALPLTH